MFSNQVVTVARRVAALAALVSSVAVFGTGCAPMTSSARGVHTQGDSRIAHFDREAAEHNVF